MIGDRDLLVGQRHADEYDAVEVAEGLHPHPDAVARKIEMRLLIDQRFVDPRVSGVGECEEPPVIESGER